MKTDMQGFEERLLHELKQVVAEQPEPATAPAAGRAARRRLGWKPRLALAAAGVAAGVAAAVVTPLVLDGGSANPAHAVTVREDGTVRVEIFVVRNAEDAEELERDLREVGVPAQVDYIPWGMTCGRPEYPRTQDVRVKLNVEEDAHGNPDSLLVAIIDPDDFQRDRTLVIEAHYKSEGHTASPGGVDPSGAKRPNGAMSIGVARGTVPPCETN